MTKKLYYVDPYIKEFYSEVLSVDKTERGYSVVLSETAFFPEEGGQASDKGYIGKSRVIDAYEERGTIFHITDTEPSLGAVFCKIDFDERFDKMQQHTAEHILCGIIHKRYGFENVGFHLGDDEVVFDIDGVLDREALDDIEDEANRAVFMNIPIETYFPTSEELCTLSYRSKLELRDNVRIVKIGDVDSCACCAPHVKMTGEIGLIKILEFEKHRGGLRIIMAAGSRALKDYRRKYLNVKRISAYLSEPQETIADGIMRYMKEAEALKSEYKAFRLKTVSDMARSVKETEGNSVHLLSDFSPEELREFSNIARSRVGGMLILLSGEGNSYKYIISSDKLDVSSKIKEINAALSGRGGGRLGMVQGTFNVSYDEILEYFK